MTPYGVLNVMYLMSPNLFVLRPFGFN